MPTNARPSYVPARCEIAGMAIESGYAALSEIRQYTWEPRT